jgi:hypothetical protein
MSIKLEIAISYPNSDGSTRLIDRFVVVLGGNLPEQDVPDVPEQDGSEEDEQYEQWWSAVHVATKQVRDRIAEQWPIIDEEET